MRHMNPFRQKEGKEAERRASAAKGRARMNEEFHKPVMCEEVLSMFHGAKLKVFFDGTTGAGGHAKLLLENHPEIELYIACDRDPSALEIAAQTLNQARHYRGTHPGNGPQPRD